MQSIKNELEKDLYFLSKKKNKPSKLDPYKNEILILRQFGLSYQKIAHWLWHVKSLKVSISGLAHMIQHVWKTNNEKPIFSTTHRENNISKK
ncbi:hypothetical protein BCT93_22835 [Vibrio lentus]|uniref:hypothetical protein n=1 Tax=Vibrio lentus TaxID=136468 RepID=UPI000C851B86|nr:hypothetical protein [Vibrio lentus]PMK67080.1 hypothetical protein BCT93_22835 [Vibrio lentus]